MSAHNEVVSTCGHDPLVPECPDCFEYLYKWATLADRRLQDFGLMLERAMADSPGWKEDARQLMLHVSCGAWAGAFIKVEGEGTWLVGPGFGLHLEAMATSIRGPIVRRNFLDWVADLRSRAPKQRRGNAETIVHEAPGEAEGHRQGGTPGRP
jgi:hypothetical protein